MNLKDLVSQIAIGVNKLEQENIMLKRASIEFEKSRKGSPHTAS
jgi:hypothetical protein